MLGSHRFVAMTDVQHISTKVHNGCLCMVHWAAVLLKVKLVIHL